MTWYEYEEDDYLDSSEYIDYDDIREELVWLQGVVDDTLGQGNLYVYLNVISPNEYEVWFESQLLDGHVFESTVDDLFTQIKLNFPEHNWVV
jgi:hypothetical protein